LEIVEPDDGLRLDRNNSFN